MAEPDVWAWIAASRLNLLRALPDHATQPSVRSAINRYLTHVAEANERLEQLGAPSDSASATA
jgi:hypothetical protein